MLVCGDSLEYMKGQPDNRFSVACFSPPYAVGPQLFDVRKDFTILHNFMGDRGRFIPFALEACRVSKLVAMNFTQLVDDGDLMPFTEELVIALRLNGVHLFDRWVMYKPNPMPRRGNRVLSNFEFILLFARNPYRIPEPLVERMTTAFARTHESRAIDVSSEHDVKYRPYSEAIPRQVLTAYGTPGSTILDPFCGSGTTLKVAKELGLDYVGVDIDAANIKLCESRGL